MITRLEQLRELLDGKKVPTSICLKLSRYNEAEDRGTVVSRKAVLSVRRQIAHERTLSDQAGAALLREAVGLDGDARGSKEREAAARALLAMSLDPLMQLKANDCATGHLATGTTGCGKTVCIGNMLVHQAYTHQCGVIHDSWWESETFLKVFYHQLLIEDLLQKHLDEQSRISRAKEDLEVQTEKMRDEYLSFSKDVKFFAMKDQNLANQILERLRILAREKAGVGAGHALKIILQNEHRPRPPEAKCVCTGNWLPAPLSVFRNGFFATMANGNEFTDFVSGHSTVGNFFSLRQEEEAPRIQNAEDSNDAKDTHLAHLQEESARIKRLLGAASRELARIEPAYEAYLSKRESLNDQINDTAYKIMLLGRDLREIAFDKETLRMKYKRMPWGGLLIDQKGSYFETVSAISKAYGKLPLLTLIQVRPSWAKAEKDRHRWAPLVRWNLLSLPQEKISSKAYAEIFCSTGASFEGGSKHGGSTKNDYFNKASQNYIEFGIELMRCLLAYEEKREEDKSLREGTPYTPTKRFPSLREIYRFLTDKEKLAYRGTLERFGMISLTTSKERASDAVAKELAALKSKIIAIEKLRYDHQYSDEKAQEIMGSTALDRNPYDVRFMSESLIKCMEEFENYFAFGKDQLSGLTGTIQNILNPYVADDMAEVFCSELPNTVEISDVDHGVVFCLAMSQKFAEERKYICVILKKLVYFWNRLRNDEEGRDLQNRLWRPTPPSVFQDECQDTITEDDQEIDKFRSVGMVAVFLTQSKVALYARLGGKERAQAFFNNVNNHYVGSAGDDDCAEMSAKTIGKFSYEKISYNKSRGLMSFTDPGHVTLTPEEEKFFVRPFEIRALPKFTFYVLFKSQSDNTLALRRYLIAPRENDGVAHRPWWPAIVKRRDAFAYFMCKYWKKEFPEFTELPLHFTIRHSG